MRILVVEDEKELCGAIAEGLRMDGYAVDKCYDGRTAWELCTVEPYDLVVLDLNLPGMDGMEVLERIRQADQEIKVLILSARGQLEDKVKGLDMGANDYLTKPFHFEELEARIRGLLRRRFVQNSSRLVCGQISFDTAARTARVRDESLALTRKEAALLEYFLLNQGRIISQEELIEHLWDGSVNSFSNSVRVHISALRRKLKNSLGYDPIINKIGQGYMMEGEVHVS